MQLSIMEKPFLGPDAGKCFPRPAAATLRRRVENTHPRRRRPAPAQGFPAPASARTGRRGSAGGELAGSGASGVPYHQEGTWLLDLVSVEPLRPDTGHGRPPVQAAE